MKKIIIDPDNIDALLIKEAADTILAGRIVALPTETVYGVAVSTQDKEAINRLYQLKNRPLDKPFTLVADSAEKVSLSYFSPLPTFGYRLMEKFWPGPLTLIYYSQQNNIIGARVPAHKVTYQILKELNMPVYLSSANLSGESENISASGVENVFGDKIDLIVDGGVCMYSKPSTVVDLTFNPFKILRSGVVSDRQIIETFTKRRILFICTGNTCRSPMAQFLLDKIISETMPYLKERYEIVSRGISAFEGSEISSDVQNVLAEKEGIEVKGFTAKRINRQIIRSSDLILTMEEVQRKYILEIEPTVEGRIFNLGKFLVSEDEKDIPDPIGKGIEAYAQAYALIKEAVLELGDWL